MADSIPINETIPSVIIAHDQDPSQVFLGSDSGGIPQTVVVTDQEPPGVYPQPDVVVYPGDGSPYILPVATDAILGGIKVGAGLAITADGVLSVTGGGGSPYVLPVATDTILGGIKVGSNLSITADGTLSATMPSPYTLPIASNTVLGGIKVGAGLSIDAGGVLSAPYSYTLPVATATTLGGVIVGSGLSIDGSGVLSASGGATYSVDNGLSPKSGAPAVFQLGGSLIQNTSLALGTYNLTFTTANVTGTAASSSVVITADALTTGSALYISSTSLAGGSLVNININSTTAANGNQTALNVSLNGTHTLANQATYGMLVNNNHAGTGSVNYGAFFGAANGTYNYGLSASGSTYGGRFSTNGTGAGAAAIRAEATSTSGIAFSGFTYNGAGIDIVQQATSLNTVIPIVKLARAGSPGTPANGIGLSIDLSVSTAGSSSVLANQLISKWVDATTTTRTSQYEIWGVNNGTPISALFTLKGAGQLQLNKYGAGTFTGTDAKWLAVDSSGNLIEMAAPSGGTATTPASPVNSVQFNNAGAFGGSANFTWNNTSSQAEVTGNIYVHKTFTDTNAGGTTGFYYNTVNWNNVIVQNVGSVYASNFNILDYNQSVNINYNIASNHSALLSIVRLGGAVTSTGTVNQNASVGCRAISSNGVFVQLNTNAAGAAVSYSHVAAMQIYSPQATNGAGASSATLATITNYYGLLIGASDEYTNASSRITNRWGIYQFGASDPNIFKGLTTVDNDLKITGAGKGLILTDTTNGNTYRVQSISGVLTLTAI